MSYTNMQTSTVNGRLSFIDTIEQHSYGLIDSKSSPKLKGSLVLYCITAFRPYSLVYSHQTNNVLIYADCRRVLHCLKTGSRKK